MQASKTYLIMNQGFHMFYKENIRKIQVLIMDTIDRLFKQVGAIVFCQDQFNEIQISRSYQNWYKLEKQISSQMGSVLQQLKEMNCSITNVCSNVSMKVQDILQNYNDESSRVLQFPKYELYLETLTKNFKNLVGKEFLYVQNVRQVKQIQNTNMIKLQQFEGKTLFNYYQSTLQYKKENILDVLLQIAYGIDELNTNEIFTGNLHLRNIIITSEKPLKLRICDFWTYDSVAKYNFYYLKNFNVFEVKVKEHSLKIFQQQSREADIYCFLMIFSFFISKQFRDNMKDISLQDHQYQQELLYYKIQQDLIIDKCLDERLINTYNELVALFNAHKLQSSSQLLTILLSLRYTQNVQDLSNLQNTELKNHELVIKELQNQLLQSYSQQEINIPFKHIIKFIAEMSI